MSTQRVEIVRRGAVAHLILMRAERSNAIDLLMARQLRQATRTLEHDKSVQAIVLESRGDAFCVGADIHEFVTQKHRLPEHVVEMTDAMHAAMLSLRRCAAPLVVSVQGVAAGGGFSLVAAGDLVVASRSARFVSAYTRSGLTPDLGGTWYLPRRIGHGRAFDLLTTNRMLDADQALAMGLVERVVDPEALQQATRDAADALAALPSGTAGAVKRLLDAGEASSLAEHLERESDAFEVKSATPGALAALEDFVARHRPLQST